MSQPEMVDVDSSNVAAIGYAADEERLHVRFKSGAEYVYFDVPPNVFEEFQDAPSKGKFLGTRIKGTYEYEKL